MKWEKNKVDNENIYYDFNFEADYIPLLLHARVVYKRFADGDRGWYYRFPGRVAYGMIGPFENAKDAMNDCENKIVNATKQLLTRVCEE